MNDKKIRSLEDVRAFLAGTTQMEFSIEGKDERYRWIEQTLRRLRDIKSIKDTHILDMPPSPSATLLSSTDRTRIR